MEIFNRKAKHNYFILDSFECGIVLRGNEVKSLCSGRANISDSYIMVKDNELFLTNSYIAKWDTANVYDVDERRDRKLLAHKREISKLRSRVKEDGVTLIPLRLYSKDGKYKVELGVCKGKHLYDKRNSEKENQMKRDAARVLKG